MDENEINNSFKETLGIRLSRTYLDIIDKLLKKGIYASKGEIVREGLRYVFEKNGMRLANQVRDDR